MENRMLRIDSKIKKKLSEIILYELRDPRFSDIISIVWVKTSPNFSSCKIGVGILNNETVKRNEIIKLLNKSAGFMKKRLAEELKMRAVPKLIFTLDDSLIYAERINDILKNLDIKSEDNESE